MKFLKTPILFLSIFCFMLFYACNEKGAVPTAYNLELDSLSFFSEKLEDTTLPDSLSLYYANKALSITRNKTEIKRHLEILNYKNTLFGKLRQYDSIINCTKESLHINFQLKDSSEIIRNYKFLAYYFGLIQEKDSSYYYYKLGNEMSYQMNDSVNIGKTLAQIAILQSDFGDYKESDKNAVKALDFLKEGDSQYLTYLAAIYNCIAISSRKQGQYNEAIYWYDKAIEVSKSRLNTIKYLNNKANAYRDLKENEIAIRLYDEILLDTLLENNVRLNAQIIDNRAFAKWLSDDKGDVTNELLKAKNMRLQDKDYWGLIASYAHLATVYESINKKRSLEYASKMYNVSKRANSPFDVLEALQKLIAVENSAKAKNYYSEYIRINDSLRKADIKNQNKYAKIKFDSEKNREENLQLRIETVEKDLAFEKEKSNKIISSVVGACMILGLLFLGFYYKKKHKLEKREEVYKTETRIAKKIHDEVANDVVNIMNKIQYTDGPNDKVLDDLERVYMLTRNISRENNEVETGVNFENNLKSMLASFNSNETRVLIKNIHKVELAAMSSEIQIEVFRILQEFLVNMQKHSQATLAVVSFENKKKTYFINYSDNGVGVDLSKINHFGGLHNVETRIDAINGTINFESYINKGFKASLSFKRE